MFFDVFYEEYKILFGHTPSRTIENEKPFKI